MTKVVPLNELQQGAGAGNALVGWNPDAWHAMQARDEQLIRDQVLHGYTGKEFVYDFTIKGTRVTGVSVVGARALASHYGGIKSRLVASVDKTGSLFVFKSFEPLAVKAEIIPQLADEPDFYEVVVEVTDLKTGNSIQVRKKETKVERKRDGGTFERPHYDVIAESKAFRNGVLSIIPQAVIQQFEERALATGQKGAAKTIDQYRDGVIAYATKAGIALDRQAVGQLTYAEISGLGGTINDVAQFRMAADSLGILREKAEEGAARIEGPQNEPDVTQGRPAEKSQAERSRRAPAAPAADPGFDLG